MNSNYFQRITNTNSIPRGDNKSLDNPRHAVGLLVLLRVYDYWDEGAQAEKNWDHREGKLAR